MFLLLVPVIFLTKPHDGSLQSLMIVVHVILDTTFVIKLFITNAASEVYHISVLSGNMILQTLLEIRFKVTIFALEVPFASSVVIFQLVKFDDAINYLIKPYDGGPHSLMISVYVILDLLSVVKLFITNAASELYHIFVLVGHMMLQTSFEIRLKVTIFAHEVFVMIGDIIQLTNSHDGDVQSLMIGVDVRLDTLLVVGFVFTQTALEPHNSIV